MERRLRIRCLFPAFPRLELEAAERTKWQPRNRKIDRTSVGHPFSDALSTCVPDNGVHLTSILASFSPFSFPSLSLPSIALISLPPRNPRTHFSGISHSCFLFPFFFLFSFVGVGEVESARRDNDGFWFWFGFGVRKWWIWVARRVGFCAGQAHRCLLRCFFFFFIRAVGCNDSNPTLLSDADSDPRDRHSVIYRRTTISSVVVVVPFLLGSINGDCLSDSSPFLNSQIRRLLLAWVPGFCVVVGRNEFPFRPSRQ